MPSSSFRPPEGFLAARGGEAEGGCAGTGPAAASDRVEGAGIPQESEQESRQILQSLPAAVYTTDGEGRITMFNKAAATLWGRNPVIGTEFWCGSWRIYRPDGTKLPLDECPMARTLKEGRAIQGEEIVIERPDGVRRHIIAHPEPIRDSTGAMAGAMNMLVDITDRKRAEQAAVDSERALRRSEERYRRAAETGRVGIWEWDLKTGEFFISAQLKAMLGYADEEIANRLEAWCPHVHPEDLARIDAAARDHLAGKTAHFEVEVRRRHRDGQYLWFLSRGNALRDADGNTYSMAGADVDITERRMAQKEREFLLAAERAARSDAERNSRLKDDFLATLSHELRTPLHAILGWANILRMGAENAEELAQGLEVIERNARAQTQIIDDLLDMSRIISGKVRLDVQNVNLLLVIEGALETVRPAAAAKQVRLMATLDPGAGPATCDPNRLRQVLWNLLSNAIKFTPRGGSVEVRLSRVESHLEISVIDTGQGIKAEFLPHVFERFRQADASTTRRQGGLGLGLAIVKNLVEMHGGGVRAKSDGEGKGSAFVVSLPISAVRAEAHARDFWPAVRGFAPLSDASPKLEGVRVVVVDDEPDGRDLVRRVLSERGAVVRTAGSADEAIEVLRREGADVLVSDIGMPLEDGYSLIRRVRKLAPAEGKDVPAIALTAFARSEDRTRAILSGFQMHVSKPVEPSELIAMVASLGSRGA